MKMNINSEPMMCQTGTKRDLQDPNKAAEVKLDGTRTFIIKIDDDMLKILGNPRRGVATDYTDRLPEIRDAMLGIPAGNFILDGEIVYFDQKGRSIFEGSQRRCSTQSPVKIREYLQTWPVQAMAFDLLYLDGKNIENHTWVSRKGLLKTLLNESLQNKIEYLPHVIDGKEQFYERTTARGEEGVVAKALRSTYQRNRRSHSWLKIKNWNFERCLVVGYTDGTGKREEFFGSLILAQIGSNGQLVYVGKVGSGFKDYELKKIFPMLKAGEADHELVEARDANKKRISHTPVKLDLEIEVRFQETSKNNVFRMPSIRKDSHKRNMIYYGDSTIADLAKPRPRNLMDMLKELA